MSVEEARLEAMLDEWKLWFDEAPNLLGNGIGAVLASPKGQCFPFSTRLGFDCTNNVVEYKACAVGVLMVAKHQVKKLKVFERDEVDDKPWYHNIKEYLQKGAYPQGATDNDKRTLRRLVADFFLSGPILYKRSTDLTLPRYMDDQEVEEIMKEVHKRSLRYSHQWPCIGVENP
ncbi:hypothetical protein CR513_29848, partial [Mucuna pruriens]